MKPTVLFLLILFATKGLTQETMIGLGGNLIVNTSHSKNFRETTKNTLLTYNTGAQCQLTRITKKKFRYSFHFNANSYSIASLMYSDTLQKSIKYIKHGFLIDAGMSFGKDFTVSEKLNISLDIGISAGRYFFPNEKLNFDTVSVDRNSSEMFLVVATPFNDNNPNLFKIQNALGMRYSLNKAFSVGICYHSSFVLNSMSFSFLKSAFIFNSNGFRETKEDQLLFHNGDSTYLCVSLFYKIKT